MAILQEVHSTINVSEKRGVITIQINRPEANNSINGRLIKEISSTIREAEILPDIKVVLLTGLKDNFCTGMDFNEVNERGVEALMGDNPDEYYEMLKLFSLSSKIIISKIEGKVNAGGLGIVAASDMAIADTHTTFALSEALFGLIPACVMPFLIRRVGVQKAQWLALTTQAITADRAFQIGLVDEVGDNINDLVRKQLLRLTRLDPRTIADLKDYMSKLWIVNQETQKIAVDKLVSLVNSDNVKTNIRNYVEEGRFPWDK